MRTGTVLSLFDFSGVMVWPWAQAGYDCLIVDRKHPPGLTRLTDKVTAMGADVRELEAVKIEWRIAFAFPPCTHLATSGARWFRRKGLWPTIDALTTVARTVDILSALDCPWMLENPRGMLQTYWRDRDYEFDPCDYGGYCDPHTDKYTKRTYIWCGGGFKMPTPRPVTPVEGSRAHKVWSSERELRERTPAGFAAAVFAANEVMS